MAKWFFTAACSYEPTMIGRDGDTHYSIVVPWPALNPNFTERHHASAEAKDRRNALARRIVDALNQSEMLLISSDMAEYCRANGCQVFQESARTNGPYPETGKIW